MYKEFIQLNSNNNNLIFKWSEVWLGFFFLKKTYKWTTSTWKDASISLIIREMKIKTTIRYYLIPVRMAIIKKTKDKQGYEEKGTLVWHWWECKLVQPLWKTLWKFLMKLKRKPPNDPAISLWVYAQGNWNQDIKGRSTLPCFFHNSQKVEAT